MSITLDEVLMLAGRLDDSAGFDTPRERFRRFLNDHVTSSPIGRALIEQTLPLVDEQYHRALQDLVVLLGRFLGFETTFGTYAPLAGGLRYEGFWQSGADLDVVLEIRTNLTSETDLDSLVRSVAARVASRTGSEARVLGLCVVTPLYPGRGRLEQRLAASKPDIAIRIGSVRSLLLLADLASAGRLSHDDIVQLLDAGPLLDAAAKSLEAHAGPAARDPSRDDDRSPRRDTQTSPGFWLATIAGDNTITPERFLEVVIGKRRIFGTHAAERADNAARPGDRICFHVAGRGAVGHAAVASIEHSGTGLRDAQQYSQLLRLANIELHLDAPVVPQIEMTLRLRVVQGAANSTWQPFMRISERDFLGLTAAKGGISANADSGVTDNSAEAASKLVSDAGSRSRE